MNILDMTDDQLDNLLQQGMNINLPPGIRELRDNMLELALRLREIKMLALEHIEKGTKVPADQLITLLDGTRRRPR